MTKEELKKRYEMARKGIPEKIETKDLRQILEETKGNDEMKLERVDVGVLPDYFSTIETPNILHLFWAWVVGYAAQEVRDSTTGAVVSSPLAVFSWVQSLAQNWWKYAIIFIALLIFFLLIR